MNDVKHILSFVRQGDFAHPGEIEAIQLAMEPIEKNSSQQLLDVGCGLGGTASYVQKNGWGKVTGIDIDSDLIEYAKKHYPDISFIDGDILSASHLLNKKFKVIYCFSSFFCFTSQQTALYQLSQIAVKDAELILFDYSRNGHESIGSPFSWSKTASRFDPIYLPELKSQLSTAGWDFKKSLDISIHFEKWYDHLLVRFMENKDTIVEKYDEVIFGRISSQVHQDCSKLFTNTST